MKDDVTAPEPTQVNATVVVKEATRHFAYLVIGALACVLFLLYANAVFGLLFDHAVWLLVLAFIGWPFVRTMHAVGRWVVHSLR